MAHRTAFTMALWSILALSLWQGSSVFGEEGGQKPAPKGPKTTAFTGTLEDKGATWIKVKIDGMNESLELKAEWIKGTRPLKANEEMFANLKVGGKVEGEWRQGDAARFAVKIKMVEGAAEGAKTASENKEEKKEEKK